ncbi:MAG: lasso peptide biosynthesis PqqD family chaperone [Actinomycetota bacterium]
MSLSLCVDVSTVETDEGMVLLDERAGRYWQLNPTGALILRTLLEGSTPQDVVKTLTERHAVSAERVAADVAVLVESLQTAGLVMTA